MSIDNNEFKKQSILAVDKLIKDPSCTCLEDCDCNRCKPLKAVHEDIIEHPKHYNFAKIQPIDVIEDWKLDFRLANALKYIARAGKKDPTKTKEDLEKALWYIRRFIEKEL